MEVIDPLCCSRFLKGLGFSIFIVIPHHWQYWVLINDNPEEGEVLIEMPYNYILEMICDWWAFSWAKGNLNEIFPWYEERKRIIFNFIVVLD